MNLKPRAVVPWACALVLAAPLSGWSQTPPRDEAALVDFFEKKVRPVLADNCYNCHSADTNARGGLRVDDRTGMTVGGNRGPAVVPGQPEKSLLIQAVRQTHAEVKMPPKKELEAGQIADLTQWIKDGAAWPRAKLPASVGKHTEEYARLRKEHWAWQLLKTTPVPAVKDAGWPRDDVDRFLLAQLEAKGLPPVADADPGTLLRRLTFDLTGLPPTPVEIESFLRDFDAKPQAALEKVVDRLLASPAFGERWGRHWLDVARYGESTGSARNVTLPHAWRYRDYVIDAFNRDKPYDQFLLEQIAGDLLPAKSQPQRDENLIATGFLALGVKDVNQRFKVRYIMDNIDEQIDTVTRSVLALTASCARCHDHKFDPIPTTDYYALAGIFQSSDLCAGLRNKMGGGGMDFYDTALVLPLGPGQRQDTKAAAKIEKTKVALASARAELLDLSNDPEKSKPGPAREQKMADTRKLVTKLQVDLLALTDPAAHGPVAFGVRDAANVGDTEIRIRGEAEKIGPVAPRGFLSLLDVPDAPKINPNQSGRLELAQWLASPKNPLTPRVLVNRVWKHLFGQGLVISVDNFGVTGDAPSNPDLLDHLAARFITPPDPPLGKGGQGGWGWSVKKLVRALVLSRAYRLGSDAPATHLAADPGNRLVWRHSPRRLDAEEIRDAMLAAAGKLNLARPVASPVKDFKIMELRNNGPEAERIEVFAVASTHRSVYLPLLRQMTPQSLDVFDFAEQGMVTGSRDATTVAPQALYLLNDPLVRKLAQALAERTRRAASDDAARIDLAYRLTLARKVTARETERARNFLAEYAAAAQEEANPPADPNATAWASFCQAILASAEFRFVR